MNTAIALILSCLLLSTAPTSTDPKPVVITGIVVERSGQPAAGADVWLVEALTADEDRRFGMEVIWSGPARPSEGTIPVLVHGRADAAGRFTLELSSEVVARHAPPLVVIWTATTGPHPRLASRLLPRIGLAAEPPVRLELAPPLGTQITVLDPARTPTRPCQDRSQPGERCSRSRSARPRPFGHNRCQRACCHFRPRARRDPCRRTRLWNPDNHDPGSRMPDTKAPDSKIQGDTDRTITVTLAPVGRVVGRLAAPRNEPIKGVIVRAATQVGGYAGSGQAGSAEVGCDEEGRFDIPAIAAGPLTLLLVFDREHGTPLRGEPPQKLLVSADRATEVTIPLRPTIKVRSQYLESGTKRPIAGVKVLLNGRLWR